jgi:hypothetical protein
MEEEKQMQGNGAGPGLQERTSCFHKWHQGLISKDKAERRHVNLRQVSGAVSSEGQYLCQIKAENKGNGGTFRLPLGQEKGRDHQRWSTCKRKQGFSHISGTRSNYSQHDLPQTTQLLNRNFWFNRKFGTFAYLTKNIWFFIFLNNIASIP